MKWNRPAIAIAVLALLSVHSPKGFSDTDRTSEEAILEKIIDASIGWAITKDVGLLYGSTAQDADFFIFNPDSGTTIIGFEAFKKLAEATWLTDDFKATRYEFRDLRIHLSKSGEVAWFSAILDDCAEFKGKAGCWKDTRYTGVLEKRDGKWVFCQMHFSFAIDKVRAEAARSRAQSEH